MLNSNRKVMDATESRKLGLDFDSKLSDFSAARQRIIDSLELCKSPCPNLANVSGVGSKYSTDFSGRKAPCLSQTKPHAASACNYSRDYSTDTACSRNLRASSTIGKVKEKSQHQEDELQELNKEGFVLTEKFLGKGTYANVFKSFCNRKGRRESLTCKIIDTLKAPDKFVNNFLPRELSILRHISHRNIVQVHTIRILPQFSKVFIFMELCSLDLFEYLLKKSKVSESQSVIWFQQTLSAVQYLHDRQIVHRDIKCTNLLITECDEIRLADFGFATVCIDLKGKARLSTTYCGSDEYASPELLSGLPYFPKTVDMWALGVVLYTMLNGCMPFSRDIKKKYKQQAAKAWKYTVSASSSLVYLTDKLLEPDPSLRFTADKAIQSTWFNQRSRR